MSNYIRINRPGGTFFFTLTLADRGSTLLVDRIDVLRGAYAAVAVEHPWRTEAIVVMPDHLHAVWTLPEGDADFSTRWKKIKTRFSKGVLRRGSIGGLAPTLRGSASKRAKGEVGIWQRRFWEHTVCDEADFAACVRYCHFNPVKHGFVERAEDWPYSSVHRELRAGRWVA